MRSKYLEHVVQLSDVSPESVLQLDAMTTSSLILLQIQYICTRHRDNCTIFAISIGCKLVRTANYSSASLPIISTSRSIGVVLIINHESLLIGMSFIDSR